MAPDEGRKAHIGSSSGKDQRDDFQNSSQCTSQETIVSESSSSSMGLSTIPEEHTPSGNLTNVDGQNISNTDSEPSDETEMPAMEDDQERDDVVQNSLVSDVGVQ